MTIPLKDCPGCDAAPGEPHRLKGCAHAACPDCGEQLIMHDDVCEQRPEDADGPDRAPLWHGVDPRAEIARTLNWWTTITGVDKPIENDNRVLFAIWLGQIVWDPEAQRYTVGTIDETALDRAIAQS